MKDRTQMTIGVVGLVIIGALISDFHSHIREHYMELNGESSVKARLAEKKLERQCKAMWPQMEEAYKLCVENSKELPD